MRSVVLLFFIFRLLHIASADNSLEFNVTYKGHLVKGTLAAQIDKEWEDSSGNKYLTLSNPTIKLDTGGLFEEQFKIDHKSGVSDFVCQKFGHSHEIYSKNQGETTDSALTMRTKNDRPYIYFPNSKETIQYVSSLTCIQPL